MASYILRNRQVAMTALTLPFLLFLLSPPVSAQTSLDREPRVKLGPWAGELKVGPGMNAVGKHLHDSEFIGQDLTAAVFDGCNLYGVRFIECDLSRASFKGACLTGAVVQASALDGADFEDAIINGAKFTSFCMSKEQLKSTHSYKTKDLRNCVISANNGPFVRKGEVTIPVKYDFRKATLNGAILVGGNFSECDFTGASIEGMKIYRSKITSKQLASTSSYKKHRLRHMCFSNFRYITRGPCAIDGKIDFSGIDLTGTRFRGRPLDADFSDAIISKCSFDFTITKEQLCSTRNYQQGNLSKIRLLGIDLSGCDLSRQNLTGCEYKRCDFSDANFEDTVITDTNFGKKRDWECTGLTLGQIQSTWNYKNNRMEGITLPKEIADALEMERQAKNKSVEKDE